MLVHGSRPRLRPVRVARAPPGQGAARSAAVVVVIVVGGNRIRPHSQGPNTCVPLGLPWKRLPLRKPHEGRRNGCHVAELT